MNPIELKAAAGLRNDISQERFSKNDLAVGTNIEVDETGKVWRRKATTKLQSGVMHSLWASGSDRFVVANGVLSRLTDALALRPIVAVAGTRVAYQSIAGEVYWTDGLQSGVITGTTSRVWGIAPPPPFAAAPTSGTMQAGSYLYTMTYVRADGKESGAPAYGRVDTTGGITFPALPVSSDPTVVERRLYLSACGGELPYLALTLTNSGKTASLTAPAQRGPQVRTSLSVNAPAGQLVGYYNGRAYVAQGRYLWYSEPFEYERFDPMSSYLAFPDAVQTFAPVSDGVFVGSETETVFLHGADPSEFVRRQVANYGTVLGTEMNAPPHYMRAHDGGMERKGPQKLWMSRQGACLGNDGGDFKNLTGGRFILPDGVVAGASLLKIRGGTPQFVTSLFS